ncbi:transmembrane ascorbate-dependent reductase CYB561-like isoform X2 [Macrobrachium rosenbergii]|uniref:transmembrane ascorbate-dependent reductase CYB561-like isoform X2 n=1 Tax=Macrobrachium rosenbergii TaxID=79674 RepID=UPI0034D64276
MDRMYRKDSTISSKISEYDNVPILPRNYYDHQYRDQDDLLIPTSNAHITPAKTPRPAPRYHSFPVDTAPPVPPHQVPLVNSHDQTSPSPHHHTNGGSSVESHTPPEHNQKPSAFPLEQEDYDSLDARLVMQHRKMLKQKKEQEELQQKLQQQQKQNQHTQTPLSPQDQPSEQKTTHHGQITKSPSSDQKIKQETGRSHRESYGGSGEMSLTASIFFYFLVILAEILMFGVLCLALYWVVQYRGGFAWREDVGKEFNFHPVLMIAGFIFFMGNAMLVYRVFRCCKKLPAKILHTYLYLMAVPCIVVATIAVFDSHNLRNPPIPNLYSLHSWLGLVTIGLFALQLVVGFFSFWILLCCEQGTSGFRAALVPVHATFGMITFMLAIATAVTGYTEKAFFSLSYQVYQGYYAMFNYIALPNEAIVINAQAMCLGALAIVMYLIFNLQFKRKKSEDHPKRSQKNKRDWV